MHAKESRFICSTVLETPLSSTIQTWRNVWMAQSTNQSVAEDEG